MNEGADGSSEKALSDMVTFGLAEERGDEEVGLAVPDARACWNDYTLVENWWQGRESCSCGEEGANTAARA